MLRVSRLNAPGDSVWMGSASGPQVCSRTSVIIPETLVLRARFIWILATQPAPISRSNLQSKCPSPSRPHGAMNLGATLTHVTVMHLTAQRVTTSLVHSSTALPHAAPRTHTQRWRAQPTPWAMPNVHRHRMRQPAMPILSRWALAWRSL